MFRRIVIIIGSTLLTVVIAGALYFYVTGGANPQTSSDLMLKTAYLNKSQENYARCYGSINYGTSLIGDVRLQIKSENFYDDSITVDRLDTIQSSFMDSVKQECQKTVDDYQQSYDQALSYQEEINSSSNALWNFLFGSAGNQSSSQDLSSYSPALARMTVAFGDYVFTEQEVKDYFDEQLGL